MKQFFCLVFILYSGFIFSQQEYIVAHKKSNLSYIYIYTSYGNPLSQGKLETPIFDDQEEILIDKGFEKNGYYKVRLYGGGKGYVKKNEVVLEVPINETPVIYDENIVGNRKPIPNTISKDVRKNILLERTIPLYLKGSKKIDDNIHAYVIAKWIPANTTRGVNNILLELEVHSKSNVYGMSALPFRPVINSFDIIFISKNNKFTAGIPEYSRKLYKSHLQYDYHIKVTDWELLSCPPRTGFEIAASSVLYAGIHLLPYVGQAFSFGENLDETIKFWNKDKRNYLAQWQTAFSEDHYSVIRPQYCDDGFGAKAYRVYIPVKEELSEQDLELLISEISVSGNNTQEFVAKQAKYSLTTNNLPKTEKKAIDLNHYSATVSDHTGTNSAIINPEINFKEGFLVIKLKNHDTQITYPINIEQPTLITEKQSLKINGLPLYYDDAGNKLPYANIRLQEGTKLFFNWALFGAGFNKNLEDLSEGISTVLMVDQTFKSATKTGGLEIIEQAWQFENDYDRFILPVPGTYKGKGVHVIKIPVEKYDKSPVYLELKGNALQGNPNQNLSRSYTPTYERISALYTIKVFKSKENITSKEETYVNKEKYKCYVHYKNTDIYFGYAPDDLHKLGKKVLTEPQYKYYTSWEDERGLGVEVKAGFGEIDKRKVLYINSFHRGEWRAAIYYLNEYPDNKVMRKPEPANKGTFVDSRDGQEYRWVKIGDQVWMAENLAYLPELNSSSDESFTERRYYVYGYNGLNVDEAKATYNYNTYGVMYNWPAAMESCPSGWHLPTTDEWIEIEEYLGGVELAGGKMKETGTLHWSSPNMGATNESGLSILPGGQHHREGHFDALGDQTTIWTSDESSSIKSYAKRLQNISVVIERVDRRISHSISVRCVRD